MKKTILSFIMIAITLLSFTACRSTKMDGQQAAAQPTDQQTITAEEAKAIALADAGVSLSEGAVFDTTGYEIENGALVYEVEFYVDGWEYDYEIHAGTGTILSHHKEKSDQSPLVFEAAPAESASTEPTRTEDVTDRCTAEEAEDIALNHAGVNRSDARFDRTEFDIDNGVPEYEIEFYADGWEFGYEIHAETGEILSSEKDRDD